MKKTIIIFVIAVLVLVSVILWAINARLSGNIQEILMITIVVILAGFALYIGLKRVQSSLRKEPAEDELSKMILTKTSSLSYYISIYLWLALMYFSDRINLETHTLIGAGILGMAVTFFLCWIGVKFFLNKNE